MEHSKGVKNYYENNTLIFLRFHRDAATKNIHQPLWKESHFTLKEAVFYTNKLIQKAIENYPIKEPLNIIDLGCGVGSSLFTYLIMQQKASRFTGFLLVRSKLIECITYWGTLICVLGFILDFGQ